MGELTSCNYCKLRDMKRRAKANGERVVTMTASQRDDRLKLPIGIDVFTIPPGVSKHDLSRSPELRKKYWNSWFMALTDRCCC